MRVKELIERLEEFDPTQRVVIEIDLDNSEPDAEVSDGDIMLIGNVKQMFGNCHVIAEVQEDSTWEHQ